jgi:hypothetical protein
MLNFSHDSRPSEGSINQTKTALSGRLAAAAIATARELDKASKEKFSTYAAKSGPPTASTSNAASRKLWYTPEAFTQCALLTESCGPYSVRPQTSMRCCSQHLCAVMPHALTGTTAAAHKGYCLSVVMATVESLSLSCELCFWMRLCTTTAASCNNWDHVNGIWPSRVSRSPGVHICGTRDSPSDVAHKLYACQVSDKAHVHLGTYTYVLSHIECTHCRNAM